MRSGFDIISAAWIHNVGKKKFMGGVSGGVCVTLQGEAEFDDAYFIYL